MLSQHFFAKKFDYERLRLEYKPRKTYKEWLEKQKAIYDEEKIKNEFKKLKNKAADAMQYEKCKLIISQNFYI